MIKMNYGSLYGALRTALMWCTLTTSDERHVFVSGAPRSGTTLLKAILENHSAACGPTYESTGLFSNVDFFRDQWWGQTGLDSNTIAPLLSSSGDIVSFYEKIARTMRDRHDASVFVDKMPWPPRRHRLWYVTSKFEGARWIHVVRDGRDCYCSAANHPHVHQSETASAFAKYWRTCVESHEAMIPEERKCTIRYEDLTRTPSSVIESVMDFVGVDFESQQIEASSRNSYDDGAEDAHSRLQKPISDASVGRWKDEMSAEDVQAFQRHAREVLRKFDYEEETSVRIE